MKIVLVASILFSMSAFALQANKRVDLAGNKVTPLVQPQSDYRVPGRAMQMKAGAGNSSGMGDGSDGVIGQRLSGSRGAQLNEQKSEILGQ